MDGPCQNYIPLTLSGNNKMVYDFLMDTTVMILVFFHPSILQPLKLKLIHTVWSMPLFLIPR